MPNAIRRKCEEIRAKQGKWGSHSPEVGIIGKAACQYLCRGQHKYCFFIIGHDRRKILHCNVTRNPHALWVVQQLREAWAYQQPHRFLLFDRDAKFGADVVSAVRDIGSEPTRTAFGCPWQNGVAERWVGSCRRDLIPYAVPSKNSRVPAVSCCAGFCSTGVLRNNIELAVC